MVAIGSGAAAATLDALTTITLINGSATLTVQPNAAIAVQGWDLGFPSIRAVSEGRTDADGDNDTTAHFGARAVTLDLRMMGPSRLRLLDDLRGFCHPSARPYLHLESPLWDEVRRIRLRVDQQTAPMSTRLGATRPAQVGWVAPDGILEAATESFVPVAPSGQSSTGLNLPLTLPATFPVTVSGGPVTVNNAGNVPVEWVARMYGPATSPVLSVDGGGALSFPGLVIAAGDYVEVNSRERTVLANGLASVSRYGFLDFATSAWWRLAAGPNLIRYSPASYSGGAAAELTFRSGWL